MLDSTACQYLRSFALASLVLVAGALPAGCTIHVGDHDDSGWQDEDGEWKSCEEEYDCCLLDAAGEIDAIKACNVQLDACNGEGEDDGDDGEATTGAGAGEGGEVDVCVSLHQTCLAGADSLADNLACEALFEHCAHPGECAESCHEGCPEDQLAVCLGDYGGCVAAAAKDYEVEACGVVFHGCVDEVGAGACLPEDDAHTDACLEEHALCTACADDEAELTACKDVFDACLTPPM
jgi:hypothetical protein